MATRDVKNVVNELIARVHGGKDEAFVEFDKIDPKTAIEIFEEIDRRLEPNNVRGAYNSVTCVISFLLMPSPVHNSHQAWLVAALQIAAMGTAPLFSIDETKAMRVTSGTRKLLIFPVILCLINTKHLFIQVSNPFCSLMPSQ
jgi:hypothetical protein